MANASLEALSEILKPFSRSIPIPGGERKVQPRAAIHKWKIENEIDRIEDYTFDTVDLMNVDFQQLSFKRVEFKNCNLNSAEFLHCRFDTVHIYNTDKFPVQLRNVKFGHAVLQSCTFQNCNLRGSTFTDAYIVECGFSGSDLRNTNFERAQIRGTDLRNIQVDSGTNFNDLTETLGTKLDRYTLASLGEPRGGLTDGHLMKMDIIDDVATLRSQFSGVWTWLHASAIVIFFFPYAWFLVNQWAIAKFRQPADYDHSMSLGVALFGFIVTGGRNWKGHWNPAWWSILSFVVFLIYNVARLSLLLKTKRLESRQLATGLPVAFSLPSSWWGVVYKVTNFLFAVAIVAAIYNTWHFLTMRVPIN